MCRKNFYDEMSDPIIYWHGNDNGYRYPILDDLLITTEKKDITNIIED